MDNLSAKKAKIRWQCRRGMLELDIFFERFNEHSLDRLDAFEIDLYATLLENYDQLLYQWLLGLSKPDSQELAQFVKRIATEPHPK